MPAEESHDSACVVCERRLLPGEHPFRFLTGDGSEVLVCELCRPRAEAAGWLTPEEAAAAGGATAGRERRRSRSAQVLGGLLARRQGPPPEEPADRGPPERKRREPVTAQVERAPVPNPSSAVTTSTTVADAVHAFNHSDHRRTVAGLTRTLSTPRATAVVRRGRGGDAIRLTIAWEITWYQWDVAATGRGQEVREARKGETIDQLSAADRAWNLLVAADGTLEEKAAATAPVEEA
jgi:hypothetical protein